MYQNLFAIDWAMYGVDVLAKVQAPKANPSLCNHISMRSTKNILYGTDSVHAQSNQPHARVQTDWV